MIQEIHPGMEKLKGDKIAERIVFKDGHWFYRSKTGNIALRRAEIFDEETLTMANITRYIFRRVKKDIGRKKLYLTCEDETNSCINPEHQSLSEEGINYKTARRRLYSYLEHRCANLAASIDQFVSVPLKESEIYEELKNSPVLLKWLLKTLEDVGLTDRRKDIEVLFSEDRSNKVRS